MAIYTYIPVKNCNIVQKDADVAIMSLNPSIVNYQTVDFCISRKRKLIIHEDSAAKNMSVQHTLQIVLHRALLNA
jgi:hypothetical protein